MTDNTDDNTTDTTIESIKSAALAVSSTNQPTSIEQIEGTLADFFKNTIQIASEKNDFQKQIEDEVLKRLSSFNETQILALLTNSQINFNDYVSKIVSPTMQLATAKQQAEIAAKREQQANMSNNISSSNIRDINQQVPGDVLAGMKHLGDFLNTIAMNNNSIAKAVPVEDAEVIKDTNTKEGE